MTFPQGQVEDSDCPSGLTRLLALGQRALGGCTIWLFLTDAEGGPGALLDAKGKVAADPLPADLSREPGAGRMKAGALPSVFHDLAKQNGQAILGAIATAGEEPAKGLLILLGDEAREPSDEEWEASEALAEQAEVVLQRSRPALGPGEAGGGAQGTETTIASVWKNSHDAMRLIDENGIVVEVNDAYCRLVEKSREQLAGQPFVVAYGYDESETKMKEFRERFARRTIPDRLELELSLWNGTPRVFDLTSSFLDVGNRPLLLTIYRDITERRKKEAEVLADAVKQRTTELGALTLQLTRAEQQERLRLANTVHDHLQQSLVAARMAMARVSARVPGGQVAETAAEVGELIDEAIDACRSVAVELSPPVFQDGGLLGALEWLAERVREKEGLKVNLTADRAAEPPSKFIRLLLFQAVRELLFNCHTHAGVTEVDLSINLLDEENIQVAVRDEGAGFDPSSIRFGGGSSGKSFGLFSLRERIDHIGGKIKIETAPGKGTRISLVVPRRTRYSVASPEEPVLIRHPDGAGGQTPAERRPGEKIRVLLVDDHKTMRKGLRKMLEEQPDMLVVGEAENGFEGLSLAQELRPDVVLIDISMLLMNGVDVTRVLSAELPEIKVIGLSVQTKKNMAEAILEAGAKAYLTKATASKTLVETIRNLFG